MGLLKENLGKRIRILRNANGWTQEMLAEKANMEYQYLGAIERGEKNLTVDFIEKIAKGLGLEAYQLFLFSTESPKTEDEAVEDKIEDILQLCDKETKKASLSVIQTMWHLKNTQEKS